MTTLIKHVFLIRWVVGNNPPKFMHVEAEYGWKARQYAEEYLAGVYGYESPHVDVLEYLVNGENGVEDIS